MVAPDSSLARGTGDPRGTVPQAPPSLDQLPSSLFLVLERLLPMALSWGTQTNATRTEEQLEGRTFDLPSSSTGRMWEKERQRKKECVKDSRMDRAPPGVGWGVPGPAGPPAASLRGEVWGQVWGAGRLPLPTQQTGGPCVQHRAPRARMMPWGASEGGGEYGVGWWDCASVGCSGLYLCALSSAASACLKTSS